MTAIKSGDVERFIATFPRQPPVTLIYGPDAGLVSERVAACLAACGAVDDPFALTKLEGDAVSEDPGALMDALGALGLFGGDRVVLMRLGGRSIEKTLEAVLRAPPERCRLIIQAGDLAARHAVRVLCERAPSAAALPCYADSERDIAKLIDEVAGAHDLRIAPDARRAIQHALGADRLLSRNELEKLALFAGRGAAVGAAEVEAVLSDAAPGAEDSAVDAAYLGDMARLMESLAAVRDSDATVETLISAAARHGALLLKLSASRTHGEMTDEALRAARVFWKRQDAVKRQLALWRPPALRSALATAHAAWAMTRRRPGLAMATTERLLWGIARQARQTARAA